ncbi:MAG TPA: hypothetical protein VNO23_08425 [Candidatus Binatia bacterium]|nr:hypothetical protein [Candidatus Binatia bacterium]
MEQGASTALIVLGGLVGVTLGLYGLAPVFFKDRLRRLKSAVGPGWSEDEGPDTADPEWQRLDAAYGLLVDSRRRESSLFGLPSAWHQPAAEVAPPGPEDADAEAFEDVLSPATPLAAFVQRPLPEPEPDVEDETLEIFREVLPPPRSVAVRARDAIGAEAVGPVRISDLLADARWTAFALLRRQEVSRT